jgi:hypothetical protein
MTEKSINQFVAEFKKAFEFDSIDGELVANGTKIEFKAVRYSDGLTVGSRGWLEPPTPRLEISGEDFIRLGNTKAGAPKPSDGVVSWLLSIMFRKF